MAGRRVCRCFREEPQRRRRFCRIAHPDHKLEVGTARRQCTGPDRRSATRKIQRVDFATASDGTTTGGTAIIGQDYVATTGTLVFAPGETLKTIPVTILGDLITEGDETFFVNLTNAVNTQLNDPQGEGRIINDDLAPPPPVLDVVLLLDDTGSFAQTGPLLANIFFTNVIPQLQAQYPGGDFAFAIARFEDYNSATPFADPDDKPFTLNQPMITDDTVGFQAAIQAALNRGSSGSGGSGPEGDIEALFQIATGAGFDGNGDGDSVDAGPAGPATTQTNANGNGDVPAYSTFVPDLPNNILPPTVPVTASPADGIGFRPGTRRIVLLATDAPFTVQPDGLTTYTGVGGVTVPATQVTQGGDAISPGGRGATIQNTVNALVADGIQVVGLGDEIGFYNPATTPRPQLTALATLTGAVNATAGAIENFITPGPSADDIQPGAPLYFLIDSSNPVGLANAIVLGISGAVGTPTPPPPPPPAPPASLPGPQADTLIGGSGNDTCLAGDFDDFINGGLDNDYVEAGGGNDSILGGAGSDTLRGMDGDDTLNGQGGADLLDGGDGNDVFIWEGAGSNNDTLIGSTGDNTLLVNGNGASNIFSVAQDANGLLTVSEFGRSVTAGPTFNSVIVNAGSGDDTVNVSDLSLVNGLLLSIQGGVGDDLLSAVGSPIGNARLIMDGGDGNDTVLGGLGDETLLGSAGKDVLNGGGGNDTLSGGLGNDTVDGGAGNDFVDGDAGQDTVRGGDGDDIANGGVGDDTVDGGSGNDTLSGNDGDDSLLGLSGNDSLLGGNGLDTLGGGDGNDTLDGGFNNDQLIGGVGDDKIRGDHGNDTISGDEGNDTINGGDGNDVIMAGAGNDLVDGADGDDTINGAAGDDILVGGDGNDNIRGGGGSDVLLGQDGDDNIDGQGGTDTVAGNQGVDVIGDPLAEIHEAFTLSLEILDRLNAV